MFAVIEGRRAHHGDELGPRLLGQLRGDLLSLLFEGDEADLDEFMFEQRVFDTREQIRADARLAEMHVLQADVP